MCPCPQPPLLAQPFSVLAWLREPWALRLPCPPRTNPWSQGPRSDLFVWSRLENKARSEKGQGGGRAGLTGGSWAQLACASGQPGPSAKPPFMVCRSLPAVPMAWTPFSFVLFRASSSMSFGSHTSSGRPSLIATKYISFLFLDSSSTFCLLLSWHYHSLSLSVGSCVLGLVCPAGLLTLCGWGPSGPAPCTRRSRCLMEE